MNFLKLIEALILDISMIAFISWSYKTTDKELKPEFPILFMVVVIALIVMNSLVFFA